MGYVIKAIKFILVSVLAVLYWPINFIFLRVKAKYLDWKDTDRISFYIATPLYYLFYILVLLISRPLELLGDEFGPQIKTFQ